MKNFFKATILIPVLILSMQSCQKDKKTAANPVIDTAVTPVTPTPTATTGNLKVEFHNMVDAEALELGKSYTNPNAETYSVSKFNYFISNIVLTKNDNSTIKIKNFYQIIKQSDNTSWTFTLNDIPNGSYKSIKVMMGVDSARNRSGAQTGALDVGDDMYWGWNQGYIFLKLEGTAPTSTLSNNGIEYHMGGYGGVNKTQREYVINFVAEEAVVSGTTTPTLSLQVNVNELFKSPTVISFATDPSVVVPGTKAKMIADNYADMITFGSLKN